jgi:hypothetical protein
MKAYTKCFLKEKVYLLSSLEIMNVRLVLLNNPKVKI